jgi:CTP synthase
MFGLCLGMQLSVIEFARNVAGLKDATSAEFGKKSKHILIDVMAEQKDLIKEKRYGGTMRLGAYNCQLEPDTVSSKAYGATVISERHRHRYELNNVYRETLKEHGMVMAGINPEKDLVEIIELKNHPFFVATQFHPEFKSRPLKPHPLFSAFIKAAIR